MFLLCLIYIKKIKLTRRLYVSAELNALQKKKKNINKMKTSFCRVKINDEKGEEVE